MEVRVFRNIEQQRQGVLPYMKADGEFITPPNTVFFFPYIHSNILSGVGLPQCIFAYALDINFKAIHTPHATSLGKMIMVRPGDVLQLPPQTVHVVETSIAVSPLTDFAFLRKQV